MLPDARTATSNRLKLSRLESTRHHKISHNVAIKTLLVDLFLEAHEGGPSEIIRECDTTGDGRNNVRKAEAVPRPEA
jgi:hypothetical protein